MPTTTYLELDDQVTGANSNTWGDVADANMALMELAIARNISIATTGGTTTLTSAQNRYPIIRLTGVLASNATIIVRTAEKNWTFINATTGSFTVTVKTLSGTGKTIARGRAHKLYCDGTNVEFVRFPTILTANALGTADALTATFEPPFTAADLVDGTLVVVRANTANATTTPTFNPDGLGAVTITKFGGVALVAGDIRNVGYRMLLLYDGLSTRWELLNPSYQGLFGTANTFTALQTFSGGMLVTGSWFGTGNGVGAGGTVTQTTSKTQTVTLNKRSGLITMHNASLAAGATASFLFNNSVMTSPSFGNCIIIATTRAPFGNNKYDVQFDSMNSSGQCYCNVTNKTGGALAEAVEIYFLLLDVATS
jgi:hypothetical protein